MDAPVSALVVGTHPIVFTHEFLREVMLRWQGPNTTHKDERALQAVCDQWEDQIRSTMEGLCLIEILVSDGAGVAILEISQSRPLIPESQVPYDEHWLDSAGEVVLATSSEDQPTTRPVRLAFYLHLVDPERPLFGPWGSLRLAPPSPIPERLSRLMQYDPPT